jgi:hypothetical protein
MSDPVRDRPCAGRMAASLSVVPSPAFATKSTAARRYATLTQ